VFEFTDLEFVELLAGRRPFIEIGALPHEARLHLKTSKDTVILSTETARKLVNKHGNHLGKTEYALMPTAIFSGLWIADTKNSCAISFNSMITGHCRGQDDNE
jgi:hypothetical protein